MSIVPPRQSFGPCYRCGSYGEPCNCSFCETCGKPWVPCDCVTARWCPVCQSHTCQHVLDPMQVIAGLRLEMAERDREIQELHETLSRLLRERWSR